MNHNPNTKNEARQQAQENYWQLEKEYYDLLETKHRFESDKTHPSLDQLKTRINLLGERLKRNEASQEYYPVKDYLLENSWLVKFQEKTRKGEVLSLTESEKKYRIWDLREEVFKRIRQELSRYYQMAIPGETYETAGKSEVAKGIKSWLEEKIWHLLVNLAEPQEKTAPEHWITILN
jgi:hypothetical protein